MPFIKEPANIERVKQLLFYDPESGLFTWKTRPGSRVRPGDIAGHVNENGYVSIGLDGSQLAAHRLAWAVTYGEWPVKPVKHRDGNMTNNSIGNLYLGKHCNRFSKRHVEI